MPLLFFSLVLTVHGDHTQLVKFSTLAYKGFAGILPALEQERLIAVLGLAYNMPYVPADNARTEMDVMHFAMEGNAFRFATAILPPNSTSSIIFIDISN